MRLPNLYLGIFHLDFFLEGEGSESELLSDVLDFSFSESESDEDEVSDRFGMINF